MWHFCVTMPNIESRKWYWSSPIWIVMVQSWLDHDMIIRSCTSGDENPLSTIVLKNCAAAVSNSTSWCLWIDDKCFWWHWTGCNAVKVIYQQLNRSFFASSTILNACHSLLFTAFLFRYLLIFYNNIILIVIL
jgi:hypothetical protein